MQVYVRLGIRLLYKASSKFLPPRSAVALRYHVELVLSFDGQGARSRLEGTRGGFIASG